jgi:glutamine amidotransferase/cyclase
VGTSEDGGKVSFYGLRPESKYYYVHSYAAVYEEGRLEKDGWKVATAQYGDEKFIGALLKDNVFATQFHPEKSGQAGLRTLEAFLTGRQMEVLGDESISKFTDGLTRRVIACLDVRATTATWWLQRATSMMLERKAILVPGEG